MLPELDLALLDDVDALERADPGGMLRAVASSGAQVREAATYVAEAGVESLSEERPRAVILSAVQAPHRVRCCARCSPTTRRCR
jgi:glucose/mannose-6-phosphate isomerase